MSNVQADKPLVTVSIVVYNNEADLEECLNCIESQTYRNLEIICVDDCSTDGSVDIIKRHALSDSRYRLIAKDKNTGSADSRNLSFTEANGEYMYFCDADDICESDMIEKAVAKAEEDKADMVIWDFYEFGKPIYRHMKKSDPSRLREDMTRKELCHIGAFLWTRLFRASSLRDLEMPFPTGRTKLDLPVHWAACIMMERISIIPERLYGYRISEYQMSRKKGKVLLDFIYVHDYLKEYLEKKGKFDEYREDYYKSLANAMYSVHTTINAEYRDEALKECRKHLRPEMGTVVKDMNRNVRLFISSLQGNTLAGLTLAVLQAMQKLYHKIKH